MATATISTGPDNLRVYRTSGGAGCRTARIPNGSSRKRCPRVRGCCADCPPTCRSTLADPAVPLFITEGQKKADALASRGVVRGGLAGRVEFQGAQHDFGGTTLLADFDYIALNNRAVYLVFDSDVMTKSGVRAALERVTEHLKRKGRSSM